LTSCAFSNMEQLFLEAGLSEQKVQETLKNKNLSTSFENVIKIASSFNKVDKNIGLLLYNLSTKVKSKNHLYILSEYIGNKELTTDVQLNCAISYLKLNPTLPLDKEEFAKECGIGVVVSPEEIESTIEKIIADNKEGLLKQRYKFNFGKLLGEARKLIKFADGRIVKREMDMQILDLLGNKTDLDMAPKKAKKENKNVPKKVDEKQVVETSDLMTQLRGCALKFHKPGENYTTEGYKMTSNTMEHMKKHLEFTGGQIRTRFPPEPNGILHIGHAKAINFNFGYAKANNGVCFLRYDDTNPEKEEEKFFVGILDMVRWLGYEPYEITHASDNFDKLYDLAVKLIKNDLAYVCHQKQSEIQGINPPPSPWRNRPIQESLTLFEDMKKGKIDEGAATLRMKHIMEDSKQDPVAYRVKFAAHHRTGDKWCIYPTYDFTHCLCDSIEHISHSLCTKEFQARRSSYYWLCNAVDVYCPVQWEYGRLNLHYTVVSKRKITKLIEAGIVKDWDDPRLYTLTALRRRGFPAEAINKFCAKVGVTGNQVVIEPCLLESTVRSVLNTKAMRRMVVKEPLKVKITNFNDAKRINELSVADFPAEGSASTCRKVILSDTIYIEKSDFVDKASKGYKRFACDQTVGLRYADLVLKYEKCDRINGGEDISVIYVTCHPVETVSKPKGFIHWVSDCNSISCELRLYSRLFKHKNPEDKSVVPGGFLTDCNEDTLHVIDGALMEKSLLEAKVFETYQFERLGYFCVDPDTTSSKMIFNLTIPLKEDVTKDKN